MNPRNDTNDFSFNPLQSFSNLISDRGLVTNYRGNNNYIPNNNNNNNNNDLNNISINNISTFTEDSSNNNTYNNNITNNNTINNNINNEISWSLKPPRRHGCHSPFHPQQICQWIYTIIIFIIYFTVWTSAAILVWELPVYIIIPIIIISFIIGVLAVVSQVTAVYTDTTDNGNSSHCKKRNVEEIRDNSINNNINYNNNTDNDNNIDNDINIDNIREMDAVSAVGSDNVSNTTEAAVLYFSETSDNFREDDTIEYIKHSNIININNIIIINNNNDNDERDHCVFCNKETLISSKHCKSCNKCVIGFDHHCKLMNCCIGKNNYAPFFIFILNSTVGLLIIFICSVWLLVACWDELKDRGLMHDRVYNNNNNNNSVNNNSMSHVVNNVVFCDGCRISKLDNAILFSFGHSYRDSHTDNTHNNNNNNNNIPTTTESFSIDMINNVIMRANEVRLLFKTLIIILVVLSFAGVVFIGQLLVFHIYICWVGITTFEWVLRRRG